MQRIFGSHNFPRDGKPSVVALGNFDGVHLGHRFLIERARHEAAARGARSVVYTFDPHPVRVLAPAQCPPLLETLDQKLASLKELELDACVIEAFTREFAHQEPASFFQSVLVERLAAAAIVVGYDFTFGMHRQGTTEVLEKLGAASGVDAIVVPAEFAGETLVSSTNIRQALYHGDVEGAAALLGRPYSIEGKVVAGRGIGRTLGARTANIESSNELIPRDGVYLARTIIKKSGRRHPSIASIGDNPTFPGAPFTIETHLIDAKIDLIGEICVLEFLKRMRHQVAFASPEALSEQIERDIEEARQLHKTSAFSLP